MAEISAPARIATTFTDLEAQVWATNDAPLLDLCRLRLGQLMGRELSPRHAADGKVAALRSWPTSSVFTDAEKAVLDFVECYAIDAQTVTDAHTDRLHQHFDEPALAALTTGIAFFDAVVRTANVQES